MRFVRFCTLLDLYAWTQSDHKQPFRLGSAVIRLQEARLNLSISSFRVLFLEILGVWKLART